jgi:phage tail sheath protein FI
VDGDGRVRAYENVGLGRAHPRWLGNILPVEPQRRSEALENPYAVTVGDDVNGLTLHRALFGDAFEGTRTVLVPPGDDGPYPSSQQIAGGLERLARLDDISIVAAPGSSAQPEGIAAAVAAQLQIHVEARRTYRIAVVDSRPHQSVGEVRQYRGRFDSTKMAFYYPWVVVANPLARPGDESRPQEIALPPSGFVCGIYARNDVERGVHKAPANEVVRGALRFATEVSFGEQEVLNPLGINCLRSFSGRGQRLWGARTASSDPEWKYVNVRRYFLYLEASIERGTHWVVFEPNGERLWANVRETIESFLYNEWRSGALLGSTPEEAYFVRCDRSTMTQNDLDNGRLICEIGVAALKPAEFVVFRIGQKTVDARG